MSETAEKHKAQSPKKLNFCIFVCSTSRYQQLKKKEPVQDVSGDMIASLLKKQGHKVALKEVIPDDRTAIEKNVLRALSSDSIDAAIFSGGTGITSSDVTIETVSKHFEKTIPGFGEIFRRLSYDSMGSAAVLSRSVAGVARGKAFFCIPGSPDAVRICLEKLILPEAAHIVKHARE